MRRPFCTPPPRSAYGLTEQELAHVLASFPLVPREDRAAVLERFRERLQEDSLPSSS